MPFKLDLHFHTESHGKTLVDHEELQKLLDRNQVDGAAITNFFDISHALWIKKKLEGHIIIVGQEIWTREGHMLGLGLSRRIDDSQSAADTIGLIHEQGGIAIAPHPFLFLGIGEKAAHLPVDAIEVYSGLMGKAIIFNYMAKRMAEKMNIPQVASTDTTDPLYIGYSHTQVLVNSPDQILNGIKEGRVRLKKRSLPLPLIFIVKSILRVSDIDPCPVHAVPCFICGKSMVTRLFKDRYTCHDCGKEQMSRISCCNGHYLCIECVLKRGMEKAVENKKIE